MKIEFSDLYREYYPKLVRYAISIVSLNADAENIVQDVFMTLWNKKEILEYVEHINAYLFRLVRNKSLDHLKHKKYEHEYVENIQSYFDLGQKVNMRFIDKVEIYEALDSNETQLIVRTAIKNLPKRCRTVFLLSRMSGLKYREISERLNISVNTVECQMGIALKKLRVQFSGQLEIVCV